MTDRQFVWYFHFVGWSCFSLGLHVDVASPNIELHVPFGFFRAGWQGVHEYREARAVWGKEHRAWRRK